MWKFKIAKSENLKDLYKLVNLLLISWIMHVHDFWFYVQKQVATNNVYKKKKRVATNNV